MKDMRDFINQGEKVGLVKRITAEVDPYLELSHIAKLNEEERGPALLFENIKGYSSPIITSVCTTEERLALLWGNLENLHFLIYMITGRNGAKNLSPQIG
jgi:4-hydroxy-3-polyprenylbenzoate decarboxylase